jgi:DNA gyrase subunit A
MAQPFTMRYPLVEGQGNFGSVDKDPPAAMRYTEARLTKLAEEMLQDLDKETVPMVPNFDGSLLEPEVLPSKVPNLLINGSSGIAVGMATSIPPHNLSEVIDAIVAYIDNPDISVKDLMEYVKGPDFPTGGVIINPESLQGIYETGRGSVKVRGKVHLEEDKKKNKIVITEIPYLVSKAALIEEIAKYAQNNDLVRIKNIRDESDKRGMRIVVEIPKDIDWRVVLKNLYVHTSLQTSYNVQMLVIDDMKRPRLMNLKQLIEAFVKHRFEVIRKRAQYEYSQYSKRAHVLEGLMKASRSIDTVVDIVRSSRSVEDAKKDLIDTLEITEEQAKAILDMRLSRLTVLEMEKLLDEYVELNKKMERNKKLIERDEEVYNLMKEELLTLKMNTEIKEELR